MLSPDQQRGQWKLGRVINVYPGLDGNVRVVRVMTGRNEYLRSVNNIVQLDSNNDLLVDKEDNR